MVHNCVLSPAFQAKLAVFILVQEGLKTSLKPQFAAVLSFVLGRSSIFQFRYEPEGTGVRIVSAGRLIGLKGEV
jgi:hypothetical protein